ncbi:MFS transporter [Caenimonas sedimenti]|uniref:MFS transporter n=1 Tax=Caenimonas sedimenti TaxID=2596921 RepID=UPI0016446720|nr:MFS transporter [Caenimonas sedimenti]
MAGLLSLTLLTGTVNGVSRVALPLYAASLGAEAWQVGLTGGMGYTGMLLLALPMGAWIDRHGSRPLFLRGIALAATLYLLLAGSHAVWQAVLLTALLGLVVPLRAIPIHTEFLAILPSLSPSRAGWNRAANMTGMFFLGPAISAAAIAAVGFSRVFAGVACGLLVAGLVGRRVLGSVTAGPAGVDAPLAERVRLQFELLRGHADLRRTMAIDFLTQMAVAYFVVFGIVLAVRVAGMPLQLAAGLVTFQGAVYVVTLLAAGKLVARLPAGRCYRVALALLAAECLLYGLAPQPMMLWIGAGLMGVGVGVQGLLSTARFADMMRQYGRGRIGGLTAVAPPAGGVLGAIGGGVLSQHLGIAAGFLALGVAFTLAALLPRFAAPAR